MAITVTGGDIFRQRLVSALSKVEAVMTAATLESLALLESGVREILEADIYGKPHENDLDPPDKSDPDSLWDSFVQELARVGGGVISAQLLNTSPHARFIEGGTDDEGTGSHYIPVVKAGALHWLDSQTGASVFAKGVVVRGIHPYRFMERTLQAKRAEVIAIYKKHALSLLR